MAEFALPKHSKIVKGIDYPIKGEAENTKKYMYTDGHQMMMKIQE